MPIPTPKQEMSDKLHAKHMNPAIDAGSAPAVREVFTSLGVPSQYLLKSYLNNIMWLDEYEDMARHARSENTLSRTIMAKSEPEFETGLADIVRIVARHTQMAPEGEDYTPGQSAFNTTYKPYRMPVLLAVVQETLQQNPSWKPDIKGIFSGIAQEKGEDRQTIIDYRNDKADHINTLGAAVAEWLATSAPPTLMMRMSGPDKEYWRKEGWRTDAREMPWQTPTAQMEEFALFKLIAAAMPKTENLVMAASTEGRRAQELTQGVLHRAANGLKRD